MNYSGEASKNLKKGDIICKVDDRYFRPSEVDTLLGDSSLAKKELGWEPKITVQEMCKEMINEDFEEAKKNVLLKEHGFKNNI